MLVRELVDVLDELAPFSLAEAWDNCGLLIGDDSAEAGQVLVALELTEPVLEEASAGAFGTILTHHPVLFAPIRRLVESDGRQRLLRTAARAGINVVSCHTNLDSAPGGIADVVAQALGLVDVVPVQMAAAGWHKFVGFVPPGSLPQVASAVFAAGAGAIGDYSECAYTVEGSGWFRPGDRANPAVGSRGESERTAETRWETVVPRGRLDAVVRAYVAAHPYEEPAFDIYPMEDRVPRSGLGRVGNLAAATTVAELADRVAREFGLGAPRIGGAPHDRVSRAAVIPGSGRSLLDTAAAMADVLITGDLSYHDAETARDLGLALIDLPHGELEWGAMRRWSSRLEERLATEGVGIMLSERWVSPWGSSTRAETPVARPETSTASATAWIDGGSRGNPGPSAIGVILEDGLGRLLEESASLVGRGTNNAAEYRALLEALDLARKHGVRELRIMSDSELLVKQLRGEYRVRNDDLRELFDEARRRETGFDSVQIQHVRREDNARADALVNEALDGTI